MMKIGDISQQLQSYTYFRLSHLNKYQIRTIFTAVKTRAKALYGANFRLSQHGTSEKTPAADHSYDRQHLGTWASLMNVRRMGA
jgi:hypothetical protein